MTKPRVIRKKAIDASATIAFILSLLIILAAGVSAYFSTADSNKKKQELERLNKEILDKQLTFIESRDRCLKLSRLVGWRIENDWGKTKGNWTDVAMFKETLDKWAKTLKEKHQNNKYGLWSDASDNDKEKLTVKELLKEFKELINTYKTEIQVLINQRTALWGQEVNLLGNPEEKGKFFKMEEKKNQEIKRLITDCKEKEAEIADTIKRGEEEIASLNMQIKRLSEDITKLIKKQEAELIKSEKEKDDYEVRLQKVQQRVELAKDGYEQDGEIIVSDSQNGYVYINLGRKDAIFGGMDFNIFAILKGGLRKDKGKIIVSKIHSVYSECSIVPGSTDPLDPIIVGDYANSRIYSRDKAKKFAFVGRPIGRYSLFELNKKIEEFGGQVLDDASADIAYLIAGEGYDKESAYEKAVYLGIVILREKELYDLLGLTW